MSTPPGCIPLSEFIHQLVRAQNIESSALATLDTHDAPFFCVSRSFFFGEADFFSAKRLFLRAARDVSGVRSSPPWARVEIKLKMSFQALSHSSSHERASALTSPPSDFLFSSIHPKPPSHSSLHPTLPHPSKPHQIKQPLSKRAINERAVTFR